MMRIFSFLSSSKTPSCSLLETSATTLSPSLDNSPRAIPKLPEVASIIVCPLLSFPVRMASWIMWTAGLILIEPVSKLESNLPKTFRSASARFKLYTFFAHSFKSSVKSISGVALTTFALPCLSSRCGTLLHISSSKCSSRTLSMLLPLVASINLSPLHYHLLQAHIKYRDRFHRTHYILILK